MKIFNNKNLILRRRELRKNSTPQEIILWSRLRGNKLGFKFRRQSSIGNYILDFYCQKIKLVIEIDGSQHFEDRAVKYDEKRSEYLKSLGCKVLRFSNNEINTNIDSVMENIYLKLQNATSPNPS